VAAPPAVAGAAAAAAAADAGQPVRILHVADSAAWATARAAGRYEVSSRGRTLGDEGFIHASTSRQIDGVLARYYADLDPAGLTLLVIDVAASQRAGSPVRWDAVPGLPSPFPHVYGPIVPAAVVAELPLGGTTGAARVPDLTQWDVAAGAPGES
jgi:uncharacterized protein (DUF952 family)